MEDLKQKTINLQNAILRLSVADTFEVAKKEWEWVGMDEQEDTCPCGQLIFHRCHLKNTLNNEMITVGSVCVNKFVGIDTGTAFDGLKRIKDDINANPNADLIAYALANGFIYQSEVDFLQTTKRKRKFSEKQMAWKRKINRRIIDNIKVDER